MAPATSVRHEAGLALAEPCLEAKADAVARLARRWRAGGLAVGGDEVALVPVDEPGRPDRPSLVAPRHLPRRRTTTVAGRVATLHALVHIEANAVNLALDAAHRFAGLPDEYYGDWLRVAEEEALHHRLLVDRLADHDAAYGDLPAHDGLWQSAVRTAHDPLVRMALVPRVLEARGLDVTPGLRARFAEAGDEATAAVLDRILADEVGHVAVGSRWFGWLCDQRGLPPVATFAALVDEHGVRVVPPFNEPARRRAGFDDAELGALARR